jgi:DGQHR domain-containing protein
MSKSENLHDSEIELIRLFFEKSGVPTLTKLNVPKEGLKETLCDIDVLGVYDNIIILVECVGNEPLGAKIKDFNSESAIIEDDLDLLIETLKETNSQFCENCKQTFDELRDEIVIKKLVVTSIKEDVCEERKTWKDKLFVWGKEDFEYFKVISDTTYDHCKFEILNSLGTKPSEITEKKHKKPTAISYIATGEEDKEKFVITFPVPVRDLLERSFVLRYHYDPETGFQRLLDKPKLKRMRTYLLKEMKSYPNSIIVVLHQDVTINRFSEKQFSSKVSEDIKRLGERSLFLVTMPDRYDAFTVIDGQHRLFSFAQDKYHEFEASSPEEESKLGIEDEALRKLANELQLVVTAIYFKNPNGRIEDFKARLFFEINTTQTRIRPEDIIALTTRLSPHNPVSKAYILLEKLNAKGPLRGMIKVKFWQENRIKVTSLIRYGGIKDIFYEKSRTHKIYRSAFEKQKKVTDYADFCYILIENYMFALRDALQEKYTKSDNVWSDVNLQKYYVTSAVTIGALIRLLRHLLSEKDMVYRTIENISGKLFEDVLGKNIHNEKLMNLFKKPLEILVETFKFNMGEFKAKGYGANRWAKIEADMYYAIQDKHIKKAFGDVMLLKKSLRRS